jgi:TP901 family phage tail tape measure protein
MGEERIDSIVNVQSVDKELDKLTQRLQEIVNIIKTINTEGSKINIAQGINESTIAAQKAKEETEKLKQSKADLARQEQAVKLAQAQSAAAAQQNANVQRSQSQAVINYERQKQQAIKTTQQQNNAAAQQAINNSKVQEASYKMTAAAMRLASSGNNGYKQSVDNVSGSVNDLKAKLKEAIAAFDAMGKAERDSAQGKALINDIQNITKEVKNLEAQTGRFQRNVGNYSSALQSSFKSILGAFGVYTGVHGVKQLLELQAETSDQLGDLRRLLKLTTGETTMLFQSFKDLGTRTSTHGLLEIAAVLERMGYAKGSIEPMTAAIDKLHVVLGKDLGDPEQIAQQLVMIENVYSKSGYTTSKSLEELGNAILTLSHAGDVTAPYILDFTKSIGGISKIANLSLGSAMGLGAGFQSLGQSGQVASTAVVQMMLKIGANTTKYAKIAGKSVEEFSKTLKDKPAEALIEVAEGAQKNKAFFAEIAESFKDLEVKGVRVGVTMGILGSKGDVFREKMKLASEALKETTNLEEQYAIKNDTLAASLDKLKKKFQDLSSDPESSIGHFFKFVIDKAANTVEWIDKMGNAFDRLTGNTGTTDISAEHLSKLARNNDPRFKETFANAISARKDDQQPFIDIFSTKDITQQANELKDFKRILDDAVAYHAKVEKEFGKTSETALNSAVGLQAWAYRYKMYTMLFQKQLAGFKAAGESADKELTDEEKKKLEAAAEKAAKMREREIKARADATKFDMETQIAAQKAIVDNDKESLADRLLANEEYYRLKDELSTNNIKGEKDKITEEIGINKASKIELSTLDKKLNKELAENQEEQQKNILKILEDNADQKTKILINNTKKQKQEISKSENEESNRTQAYYKSGKITAEQYEAEKLRIKNKYAILDLQSELEGQQGVLDIMKLRGVPVEEQEAKIQEIKNKLRDLDLNYFEDTEKKKTEAEKAASKERQEIKKQELESAKELAKESINAIFSITTASFENQKNAIQEQIDNLDALTQKEIEGVNASADSQQDKADRIAIINARAAGQKEALERRQRQIDQEKAKFDRLKSIGEVIAGTAVNIVKVFPNPVLIALAAAIGGAQLAQILATPIPKYKMGAGVNGRPAHKGGIAQVNDGGRLEVLQTPDGAAYMAKGMNALVNMPVGTKVYPSLPDYFNTKVAYSYKMLPTSDKGLVELKAVTDTISNGYQRQTAALLDGMQRNKTKVQVVQTWGGMKVSQETISGQITYLAKNVYL